MVAYTIIINALFRMKPTIIVIICHIIFANAITAIGNAQDKISSPRVFVGSNMFQVSI